MLYQKLKSETFVIAGPCVMESEDMVMKIAEKCVKLCEERKLLYIFKASFDKANRTSASSFRGFGMDEGLKLLEKVKNTFGVPITTDIHESYQAEPVGQVADILQIPAFLCRQTDLLLAAAATNKIVNIKKAQFLSGLDMAHPVNKVLKAGNDKVLLTERGTMFGYNNLVVDFRNLVDMRELGVPVVMDVTHSTQRPGGLDGKSGGDSKYARYIAAAAAAVGVDGYFFEVHPEPEKALSDGPNMIKLDQFGNMLDHVLRHHI
jgi:2-dehydro-3-deoxyphosphooctonate aldolase (KDO 8-P synthase)